MNNIKPQGKRLRVGDEWIIHMPHRLPAGVRGKIVVLTTEPGRHVGVEFDRPLTTDDLEGRVRYGYGMWVHPLHLLTDQEYQALVAQQAATANPLHQSVTELTFDPQTGRVV